MGLNWTVLGKIQKAYVCLALDFDAEMINLGHTVLRRSEFAPDRRRKCWKLYTVPCALLLDKSQIHLRPAGFGMELRP